MFLTIVSALIAFQPAAKLAPSEGARSLVSVIESLQSPMSDFRCEFEGSMRFLGKSAENERAKIDADGLYQTFSGIYVWRQGGDIHCDSLVRSAADGALASEGFVHRSKPPEAEVYGRLTSAPMGRASVRSPRDVSPSQATSLGSIFLLDQIKQDIASDRWRIDVADEESVGRSLKTLSYRLIDVPDQPVNHRMWIDLSKTGQVIRKESYALGKVSYRFEISLKPFKVGNAEVWMPVSGEGVGYAALSDHKIFISDKPTYVNKIYVVDGTMEFNKHPGPEAFTVKYKLGTPISDSLRKMTREYGQQELAPRPTKPEIEKMLKEAVVRADAQKKELVVASYDGPQWMSSLPWGFGTLVLVASVALLVQRVRR